MRTSILLSLAVTSAFGCGGESPRDRARALFSERQLARVLRSTLSEPTPDPTNSAAGNPDAIELGRHLFYDARLSGDGSVSCASCHDPARGWADGKQQAAGLRELEAHTPALTNVAHQRWFFWDGRADSLWAQALQPIEHPDEQGGSRLQALHLVANDGTLSALYNAVFEVLPDHQELAQYPPSGRPVAEDPNHPHQVAWSTLSEVQQQRVDRIFSNLGKAIAAFEERITTAETPFDRFVAGLRSGDSEDLAALDQDARAGAQLFFGEARCHLCHNGPMLSDLEFHDVRVPRQGAVAPGRHGGIAALVADPFNGLGSFSDDPSPEANVELRHLRRTRHNIGEFKTPTLRNVARTAPYMHNGAFATLEEVVEHYSSLEHAAPLTHQDSERVLVPLDLEPQQKQQLVAFLESLTAPLPAQALLAPNVASALPTAPRHEP